MSLWRRVRRRGSCRQTDRQLLEAIAFEQRMIRDILESFAYRNGLQVNWKALEKEIAHRRTQNQ